MTTTMTDLPAACRDFQTNLQEFAGARLGLFIHYGLYSLLGRGEWAMNREQIPFNEYKKHADHFDPAAFDADAIAQLAKQAGFRYICFSTMHHEGFALYDSQVNSFNSVNVCGRDLVAEMVAACRKHGLRVHLYHTLNQWASDPSSAAAYENRSDYEMFISYTFDRIRELLTRFNPVECLWYDGTWPFNAEGWQAKQMNQMVRSIQPHILVNGRNGLPGDFATPEQHMSAPRPWRPWEACITHNGNWGYHAGDRNFKPTWQVIEMLTQVTAGAGNLLLNVGPTGAGTIPEPSVRMLEELGQWVQINHEAIYNSDPFTFDYDQRRDHRGDWSSLGRYTARGNTLYQHITKWSGMDLRIAGIEHGKVQRVRLLGSDAKLSFQQEGGRLEIAGLPSQPPHPVGGVVAMEFDAPPMLYLCGGIRPPRVDHPRYDPGPSDLLPH